MTRELYTMLVKKYPVPHRIILDEIDVIDGIRLRLTDKSFLRFIEKSENIIEQEDIGKIAENVFNDVNYTLSETEEGGVEVYFSPDGIDDYSQKYRGHYIAVERLTRPSINISTGNRGQILLDDRQRRKYFEFVNRTYEKFLESAKEQNF